MAAASAACSVLGSCAEARLRGLRSVRASGVERSTCAAHWRSASPRAPLPQCHASVPPASSPAQLRRRQLFGALALVLATRPKPAAAAASVEEISFAELEALAKASYQARELVLALSYFDELVRREPGTPVWRERRGQVLLDLKRFEESIADYNAAASESPSNFVSLGLLANRALAYEGLSRWSEAERDYTRSLELSAAIGSTQPYVLNSRGNARASQGDWAGALQDFRASSRVFRESKNLSGSVYAESNAALVEAQLRLPEAMKDLEAVARRAAGSIDMRVALAALRWADGDPAGAERDWEWACSHINSGQIVPGGPLLDGCALYRDDVWVRTVRRWPPLVADKLLDFLALRASKQQS